MNVHVVTVVTNFLLAECNITVHVCGCYDMASDRISSELPSLRLYVAFFLWTQCMLDRRLVGPQDQSGDRLEGRNFCYRKETTSCLAHSRGLMSEVFRMNKCNDFKCSIVLVFRNEKYEILIMHKIILSNFLLKWNSFVLCLEQQKW